MLRAIVRGIRVPGGRPNRTETAMIVSDPPAPADHRRLGRELDIFDSHPLIGAGLPFWLPAGAAARFEIESYLRELERRAGYQFVYSPVLGKRALYERSGHLAHFADDMFPPMRMSADD